MKNILRNALISLLMAAGMASLFLLLHAWMYRFPELYDGFCRCFGVTGTICSKGEAMVRSLLFLVLIFIYVMIALCVEDVKQIKTKGKKGGEE